MKKGKILSTVLAFTLSLSCLFATACNGMGEDAMLKEIGEASETYVGTVSQSTYSTSKAAAEAFIEEEVVGDSDYSIVKSTSKGELSSSEIKALNLPSEISQGARAVEEFEIEYSLSENTYIADKYNPNKTIKVYVIKFDNMWKYYSPLPITGETITKSYYDSVFDYQKYKNCTFTTTSTVELDMTASYQGETETIDMTMEVEQVMKLANNKVYLEQSIKGKTNSNGTKVEQDQTLYVYLESTNNQIECYIKMGKDEEWINGNLSTVGFSSLEELTPFYDQYLDYSFFTKTETGFEVAEEHADEYVSQTLDILSDMIDISLLGDMNIDMYAKYYVCSGVLSGMLSEGTLKMDTSIYGVSMKLDEKFTSKSTCTNYGETVVEKPF